MRFAALLALCAATASAHEIRPAYLELREVEPGAFDVLWKVPVQGALRLPLAPRFPPGCVDASTVQTSRTASFEASRWRLRCPGGLSDGEIAIENLELTLTDALVRIEFLDRGDRTARLRPGEPAFVVPAKPGMLGLARDYGLLGVEHILAGVDHLLFVLALLMIVAGARKLLYTITAFTLAHSVTLAAATLGWVHAPQAPIEAAIALSILFLATEIVHGRRGRITLTHRKPWLVAFAFGLLHGFGFAGALAEIGLPETAIPVTLLTFNLGVEVGQILFVGAALAVWALLRRLPLPPNAWVAPTYAIGAVAAYWTIERVVAF